MRLKALHLIGFKSFADRTELELDRPLTALVGPNGCGKSNLVDAIRWALGEQSARLLRGREMADVIFSGTESRKPTGYAEVSLSLVNDDRALPVDLDEVAITRRLYRSGESEYLLNKEPVRLRDLRQLLLGTGLGVNAYSIIEQGKVDFLLTANAKERRTVFEEAAGISRFKAQRHECELKLERTLQNLLRTGDIIEEVDKQVRSVKYQAAKARRYQDYTARLKNLRARLALIDYRRLVADQEAAERRVDEASAAVARLDEERDALSRQRAQAEDDLSRLQDDLNQAERRGVELAGRLANAEAEAHHQAAAGERLARQADLFARQADESAGKLDQARRRCRELETALADLTAETDRRRSELAQAEAHLAAQRRALDQAAALLDQRRTAAIDLLRRLSTVQNELSAVAGLERTLEAQRTRQVGRREELKTRSAGLAADRQRLAAEQQDGQARLGEVQARLDRLAQDLRRAGERLDADRRHLAETRQRLSALQGRHDLLDRMEAQLEGVGEAVKRLLERVRNAGTGVVFGVHGLVADLVRVPRAYAAAIEAALGPSSDYLVVDTPRRARSLIEGLGQPPEAADPVGFVCLQQPGRKDTKGAGQPPAAARRSTPDGGYAGWSVPERAAFPPGYVGLAVDLIDVAPVARPALAALLDGTVVAADLADALAIVAGNGSAVPGITVRRAVTLAGDVVSADGDCRLQGTGDGAAAPVADAPASAAAPRPGGRIWRRSELEHLAGLIAALRADIAGRETALAEVDGQVQALEAERAELAAGRDALSVNLVRLADESERLAREQASLADELALLASELAATERDLAEARSDRETLGRRQADLEAEHQRLGALLAEDEAALEAERRAAAAGAEALTQVKVALAGAEARRSETESNLTAAGGDLAVWERAVTQARASAETARHDHQAALDALRQAQGLIETLRRDQADLAQTASALAAERARLAERRAQVEAQHEAFLTRREALIQERQEAQLRSGELRVKAEDLLQRTREELGMDLAALHHEEANRPPAEHQGEPVPAAQGEDGEPPAASGERPASNETAPEGRAAPEGATALPPEEDLPTDDPEELRARIADLREKIERLGGVNMEAINELDELEVRSTFLTRQRDDLLKAKTDLEQVIRKISHQCREMFTATFEQVRTHFQELFRKLFGGGRADMFLEEGEETDVLERGIEIVARPPGKEPQTLSLLSGGEKVLTAVALLLAVFRSNPSPFCVLDEVDAALDESAIGRFAEVLKEFVGRSQFVIVTHNKRTMSIAETLYGVTMPEPGVSRVVTVRLAEVEERLAAARVA